MRDARDLFVHERVDFRNRVTAPREFAQARAQARFDHAAHEIGGGRFEAQRLHGPVFGNVNRVIEAVLNVPVERRHEPVPQSALREDEEAQSVDLVHHLHDTREE